ARNGAGFVAEGSARAGADQAPRGSERLLLKTNPEARRKNVSRAAPQSQMLFRPGEQPFDAAVAEMKLRVFRNVKDVRITAIDSVAFRPALRQLTEHAHPIVESGSLQTHGPARVKILTQNVGREGDRAAGVLLFAHAVKVGCEADLSLD